MLSIHDRRRKPYNCNICYSTFADTSKLNEHVANIHVGEKAFKCITCDPSFSLKQHVYSGHEGKKPFKCNACKAGFSTKSNFRSPILSIHKERKSYKCNSCDSYHCSLKQREQTCGIYS